MLFIDYLSKLKRDRVIKKFIKIARHAGTRIGFEDAYLGRATPSLRLQGSQSRGR